MKTSALSLKYIIKKVFNVNVNKFDIKMHLQRHAIWSNFCVPYGGFGLIRNYVIAQLWTKVFVLPKKTMNNFSVTPALKLL